MSCLLVILDGCREDYINHRLTPFLASVRDKGSYSRLNLSPSFAARVELLTGNSPATTDTFCDFCFDPRGSPFKFFRFMRFPSKLSEGSARREQIMRYIRTQAYYLLSLGNSWVDFPPNIPLSLLSYFNINQSLLRFLKIEREKAKEHLFGILVQHGFDFRFIVGHVQSMAKKLQGKPMVAKYALFLHYMDLDKAGHEYGPGPPLIGDLLKRIDASIKGIYDSLGSAIDFIAIFGDHNMEEVTDHLNLWQHLQELDSRIPRDYVVFLNSPVARFWFRNDRARREVRELLDSLGKYGREVTKDELKEQELPVDEKYGEVIFWLKRGVEISPDFYHEARVKGMHMYFDYPANTPLILFHKDGGIKLRSEGRLRDVMPTILNLLNIQVDMKLDGESLVAER